jgi:CRISPR-associated endonuclease Csn1
VLGGHNLRDRIMQYTLGLDIGSNSIGWALLETERKPSILDMGVRVFPEGVDRDTQGLEKPKNATRREARGARRTRQRRNQRKEQLLKTLRAAGLLPTSEPELMKLFQQKHVYEIRKRGLDEKLDLFDLGRALYHINQRRGFKSNRKSGKAKEDGVVIKSANEIQKLMDDNKCRTLGEYFAGLNPEEKRIRGKYTFRSMYEKEFDLLWEKQKEFYPGILTDEFRKKIRDEIIFFQRPLKPQSERIGNCELEPGEKRCPRGDWYSRHFRLLQELNNLKIQNPDGSETKLSDEQRKTILDELGRKEKLSFNDIRKKLGLIETQKFNAEYRIGTKGKKVESIKGDSFAAIMGNKKVFGPKMWGEMSEQKKIELNSAFVELEDDALAEKLKLQYGLNDKQVEQAMKISLPQGYMSFSRKAILRTLPFMEKGCLTSEAIEKAGYRCDEGGDCAKLEKLPLPPDLRNPIVQKALFEVRKVVNAIIREYGKPKKIKIEMARDVQGNRRQREELHWKQHENEMRNEDVRKRLKEDIGINDPKRDDIIKYKLWEECNWTCPYTGRQIEKTDLFFNPVFQVEHILPYDRSLDDSYMNKTLCEVHENKDVKRNQTPYEAYSHDTEKYEQILERVNKSHMPYPKKRKFWQKEIDLDKHIERELNDTRYICKEVISYLKQLGVNVQGTRGKITSELRHQWGLDGVFDEIETKRNDDHRRHAVDAVVVGVTENEHLRNLAKSKYAVSGEQFELPWPDFRDEVRENVKQINVSHRVQRKVSGKLHEETNYGPTKEKGLYVFRKKLEDLTISMVNKIVDPVVRELVTKRLKENGVDLEGSGKPPKEVWKEPLYMKTTKSKKKVLIKKVRVYSIAENMIPMMDEQGRPYRYVEPGGNHHVEIFEYVEGVKKGTREAEIVTMFESVRRSRAGEPVIRRDHGPGKKFICSLAINEMVMMPNKKGETDLFRIQKMSSTKQIYFRHHTAGRIDDEDTVIRKQATLFDGYKVTVDPLGKVLRAND